MKTLFNIQQTPPTLAEIEKRREELTVSIKVLTRVEMIIVIGALIALLFMFSAGFVERIDLFVYSFCVFLVSLVVGYFFTDNNIGQETDLALLTPIPPLDPRCPDIVEWVKRDNVIRQYQNAVAGMGRSLMKGEVKAMQQWIESLPERHKEEEIKEACSMLQEPVR